MIILDCEASGLHPDSYPIQIAWVDLDSDAYDTFYIKPHESWEYWDDSAEHDIHRISRKLLHDVGITPQEAIERLKPVVAAHSIASDAPTFDGFWLSRLSEVSTYSFGFPKLISVYDVVNVDECYELSNKFIHQDRTHDALDDCIQIKNAILEVRNSGKK